MRFVELVESNRIGDQGILIVGDREDSILEEEGHIRNVGGGLHGSDVRILLISRTELGEDEVELSIGDGITYTEGAEVSRSTGRPTASGEGGDTGGVG